jgi:peptidoglycan/LPS O-acetylase OafA/YrhL
MIYNPHVYYKKMGYALNVAISVPLAIIMYMLTEKLIINLTSDNKFDERVQKSFVMGFIIGLFFIGLGMTVFAENSNMDNQSLQLALYMAGTFLILNSVLFNWNDLNEGTKIIILSISAVGIIIYTYTNKRSYDKF